MTSPLRAALPPAARRIVRRLRRQVTGVRPDSPLARLEARLRGSTLELTITPRPNVRPVAVWSQSASGWTELAPVTADGDRYRADLDLAALPGDGPDTHVLHLELDDHAKQPLAGAD